jgi:hypothetical protein
MSDPPIGTATLPDGSTQTVYQDAEGKQYILGKDGDHLYGDWLLQEAEPGPDETPDDG